jgi:hypothetical protein
MKWSDPFPARAATTEGNNKSDSIKLATWILLGVTVATFVARQVMKAIVFRKLALDDYFILTATVYTTFNLQELYADFERSLPSGFPSPSPYWPPRASEF